MLVKTAALPLLREHPLKTGEEQIRKGHVGQERFWVAGREEPRQLAAGLSERDWLGTTRRFEGLRPFLHLVNQLAKLLGELAMATASSLSCDLDGDRIKPGVITIGVTPDQRFDLVGTGHGEGGAVWR